MAQTETTQTEVGHAGGEAHSSFPPFDATTFPSQLLWFFVAFGFLYWFMAKRGLPQIGAVIESRRARIARDLDDATAMQQRADAAAAAHEKTLANARAKAQAMAQAARDQASADAEAKRRALEDQLAARLAAAEREIAATRERAMANVAQIAEETAGAIVERLAGRSADPAAVKSAIRATQA
ncbi:MAG TPA: F0F1 ATP synthase subunit B [Roseiarcus sp.]|nr:F0F1 ATP synthase subunit B [Roseiarcus sp.]